MSTLTDDRVAGVGRASGTRNQAAAAEMQHAVQTRQCPFCNTERLQQKNQPVGSWDDYEHWLVFRNISPLDGVANHIMVVPRPHAAFWHELPGPAIDEVFTKVVPALAKQFGTYALLGRVGNGDYNSSTIDHLHLHFMTPHQDCVTQANLPQLAPTTHAAMQKFGITFDQLQAEVREPMRAKNYLAMARLAHELDVLRAHRLGKATPMRWFVFHNLVLEDDVLRGGLYWHEGQQYAPGGTVLRHYFWPTDTPPASRQDQWRALVVQWRKVARQHNLDSYSVLYHGTLPQPRWMLTASNAQVVNLAAISAEANQLFAALCQQAEQRNVPWDDYVDAVRQALAVIDQLRYGHVLTTVKLANKVRPA